MLNTDTSGAFTLHSNGAPGCLPITAAPAAKIAPFYQRIYFVSTCSGTDCSASGANSIPTLKRIDITPSGAATPKPIVDGIENLQFDYGIDTTAAPGDGSPDVYTNTTAHAATVPSTLAEWQNVMAVRIHVLARNLDTTGGHTDTKTYALGPVSVTPGGGFQAPCVQRARSSQQSCGTKRVAMMKSRTQQRGIAMVIGMIFLVLLTLLVISAINSGTVNLRITSNMQSQDEARAVASQAIEKFVSSYANFYPTPTAYPATATTSTTTAPATTRSRSQRPSARARHTQIPGRSIDCANGVKCGLYCWDTLWEVTAIASDTKTGVSQSVTQGVRAHVFTRFYSVFSRLLARSGRKR